MKLRSLSFVILLLVATASVQAALPESKWASLDGNRIHYYDIGNGKTKDALVLIHGWTCNTEFWKDNYDAFAEYRVIVVDLPGHGRSDKPKLTYSMEYFAKAVDAVMKHAGVKRAVLAGHSMGTPIARQFYRLYPDRTRGIVIVDGALKTFFPKPAMDQFVAQLRTNYKENSAKFIDGMLTAVKDDARRKFIRDAMLATPDYVAVSAMEGMGDEKIWTDDKINVPVLAVMAPSPFWPPNVKDIFASVAPNIDFHMWTDVSHFLHMEKPKEFNESVRAYIVKNKLL